MPHQRPVLAANWKMNHGPAQATAFMDAFLGAYPPRTDRTVIVFPSALAFAAARAAAARRPDLRLGVQNVSTEEKGAFTGESSAAIAAEAGAAFVLVGHSERRQLFGETVPQTAQKCARVAAQGLVPVLCIGETIEQRERDETDEVVLHQLRAGLSTISPEAVSNALVAYEPVWAIGTGRTATPANAAAVHRVIRSALVEMVGRGGRDIPILYGGSANAGNAAALLAAAEVDGLLVGGASLEPEGWARICGV